MNYKNPKAFPEDFSGINYYQSRVVGYETEDAENMDVTLNTDGKSGTTSLEIIPGLYEGATNPYLEKTDWDWEVDTIGLRVVLNELNDRHHLPIIITESGIGGIENLTEENQVHDKVLKYKKYIHDHL